MSAPEPRPLPPRPDPPPGLRRLAHRPGGRDDLRDALLAALAEVRPAPVPPAGAGPTLGSRLDVAGDPAVSTIAELWGRVADSIAAYTELAAGERYLGTAQDWTDLRRTSDLLGHRPAQRTAARGWVRCITDRGVSLVVPAGTRVQAPATATTESQTFESITDTQLRADWADLTVTAVPAPQAPPDRSLRLLADPGFTSGDRVLLVAERPVTYFSMPTIWSAWLAWIFTVTTSTTASQSVRGVVRVTDRVDDLGAFLVTADRPLGQLLTPVTGTTYAAHRVRASLDLARRLAKLSFIDADGAAAVADISYSQQEPVIATQLLVTDASAVTPGVRIIVWNATLAHLTTVASVDALSWEVAPGTSQRVGRITLTDPLPLNLVSSDVEVALVDQRVVAQHYELPPLAVGVKRLRVHPRPAVAPSRLAVRTTTGWELATCSLDADDQPSDTGGMLLALGSGLTGTATAAPASANLVAVRHGATSSGPLTLQGATTVVPGPVTGDIDPAGSVTNSLAVRVDGVQFHEVGSLYSRGPGEEVFAVRLAADGRQVLQFGDGVVGAAPRGEVTARWRVGGGLGGELDAARIDTLLGSVRGVRKVAGVGRTTGAADQEDGLQLRKAAAARVRALDRAVSAHDLADLALTVPGTSHAAAWRGAGPAGCPCGRVGLHLAFLRVAATGVRAPLVAELVSMAGYLDARRDTTVALCVAGGVSSPVSVTATLAVDPRREPSAVRTAAELALSDPLGPLAARPREMGVPLDVSDVVSVVHRVPGVVGVPALVTGHGVRAASLGEQGIGRAPAERYEVLSVEAVTVVTA